MGDFPNFPINNLSDPKDFVKPRYEMVTFTHKSLGYQGAKSNP